jgi:hypothetical protein
MYCGLDRCPSSAISILQRTALTPLNEEPLLSPRMYGIVIFGHAMLGARLCPVEESRVKYAAIQFRREHWYVGFFHRVPNHQCTAGCRLSPFRYLRQQNRTQTQPSRHSNDVGSVSRHRRPWNPLANDAAQLRIGDCSH